MSFPSNNPTAVNVSWKHVVANAPRSFGWQSSATKITTDIISLLLAFAITLRLRLLLGGSLFARIDADTLSRLTPPVWLLLVLWLFSAWWARLYRSRRQFGPLDTVIQVTEAMGLATVLVVLLSFALYENGSDLSRAFLALLFGVGVACALTLRGCLWLFSKLTTSEARQERALIVGQGKDTIGLINRLAQAATYPVVVQGVITTKNPEPDFAPSVPVIGTTSELRHALNQTGAERVFVVDTEVPVEGVAECIEVCAAMGIPLNCTNRGLTSFTTIAELTDVAGLRLLEIRRNDYRQALDIFKRITDIVIAVGLLAVLSPLLVILGIAIKMTSRGPILFVSTRVGRGGRHFKFLKFRSMQPDAEAVRDHANPSGGLDGHIFKVQNDSRVTSVGRLMRRLSLDELPQLWNVVRGDMSLVGPRPLPARDLEPDGLSSLYREWSIERASINPGMTGLWQVRGRSALPFEEMARLDLLYVRTRSYRLDLQILLETIPAVIIGRGAM